MIKTDRFEPNLDKGEIKRLVSTFIEKEELPEIKPMRLQKNGEVSATVVFKFYIQEKGTRKYSTKIIAGASEYVYKTAAKQSARISLSLERKFREKWNEELMKLLNQQSKDKAKLNLSVSKNNKFGIYDIKSPGELLSAKIIQSGLKNKDVANLAGIDEVTLYRHTNNQFEKGSPISRDMAIIYGKILGCDPADLLFNALQVPVWAITDTVSAKSFNKYHVYPGELTENTNESEIVVCPRNIYRPDIKAIKIVSQYSPLNNHVAFYYDNNKNLKYENQLCVVGTYKNFTKNEARLRYFLGIVENKGGNTINVLQGDPAGVNFNLPEADEDFHDYEDARSYIEEEKYIIKDIEPISIHPVASLINPNIDQSDKQEIIKAYDKYYAKTRSGDKEEIEKLRKLRLRAALQGKLTNNLAEFHEANPYYNDSFFERTADEKIKALASYDDKFKIAVKQYASAIKPEKKIDLNKTVEDLSKNLSVEENLMVNKELDKIQDDMDEADYTPEPEEEDKIA